MAKVSWNPPNLIMLMLMLAVMGTVAPATAQTVVNRKVTFTKDIAPILQRSCQTCHRPDSVAPMALLTYANARPYARAMKQRTALRDAPWGRGVMPPWYVEKSIGIQKFKDDPSLSDEEIALFAAWADSGAPEGDPADLPPPLKFGPAGVWALGKPDLIVSSPSVFVPAVRSDWTGDIVSPPAELAEDRYIKSLEFLEVPETDLRGRNIASLGGRFVFHHAGLSDIDHPGNPIALAPHEVGRNGEIYPPDAGLLLKAHPRIQWGMHIHSSGTDRNAHLDAGFRLHPSGYEPKYKIKRGGGGATTFIEVDPGRGNQQATVYWIAPENIKLLNYEPHLHATGVRMCLNAIYGLSNPDNSSAIETLNCAGYDHNWTRNYSYDDNATPLLPKGTLIQTIAWFDNSAANKNVFEPRNLSRHGFSTQANMLTTFNMVIYLTDEQYKAEVAKRKEYLRLTGDDNIGCPDRFDPVASPNYLPATAATGGSR